MTTRPGGAATGFPRHVGQDAPARGAADAPARDARAMTPLACVGLAAFVATTPVFPLTHGVLDHVAPDLTSRAFMAAAGVTAMLLAVILSWRLFGSRPVAAPRPHLLFAGGAAYLLSLTLGVVLYGSAAPSGFEVPHALGILTGGLFGIGMFLGFCCWWLVMPVIGAGGVTFSDVLRALCVIVMAAIGAERVTVALPVGVATGVTLLLSAVGAAMPGVLALLAARDGAGIPEPLTGGALYDAVLPAHGGQEGGPARPAAPRRGEAGGVLRDLLGEEGSASRAPAFFIGLPLAVFLLYASSFSGVVPTRVDGDLPGFAPAALVACVVLLVASVARDDARVAAVTFRVILPLAGVAVLGASTVIPDAREVQAVSLGAQGLCYAYGILMFAFVTYAGVKRLGRGMAFAACVTAFAVAVVMMLPYYDVTLGALSGYTPLFTISVLVVALGFLVSSPSLVLWQGMFLFVSGEGERDAETFEDKMREACDRATVAYGLTAREAEVLQYLGRGYGPAYIATLLPIKENTIRSHVRNIYGKMGVRSRGELLEVIDGFAGPASLDDARGEGPAK